MRMVVLLAGVAALVVAVCKASRRERATGAMPADRSLQATAPRVRITPSRLAWTQVEMATEVGGD